MAGQTILKEDTDHISDISEEDLIVYARQIGIDVTNEKHLMWIAQKGLQAPVPNPWCPVEDELGRIYYYNEETEESVWEHPADAHFSALVLQERENHLKNKSLATTCSDPGFDSKMPLEPLYDGKNVQSRNTKGPLPMLSSLADAPPLTSGGKTSASLSKDIKSNKASSASKNGDGSRFSSNKLDNKLAPMKLGGINLSQNSSLEHADSGKGKTSGFPKGSLMKNTKYSLEPREEETPIIGSKRKDIDIKLGTASHRSVKFDLDDNSDEATHYSYEETDYDGDEFPDVDEMMIDRFGLLDASQLSPVLSADESPEPLDVNSLVKLRMRVAENTLQIPEPLQRGLSKISGRNEENFSEKDGEKLNKTELQKSSLDYHLADPRGPIQRFQYNPTISMACRTAPKNAVMGKIDTEEIKCTLFRNEVIKPMQNNEGIKKDTNRQLKDKSNKNQKMIENQLETEEKMLREHLELLENDWKERELAVNDEHKAILDDIVQEWKIKISELEEEQRAKLNKVKNEWLSKTSKEEANLREEKENKLKQIHEQVTKEMEKEEMSMKNSIETLRKSNEEELLKEKQKLEKEIKNALHSLQMEMENLKQQELEAMKKKLEEENAESLNAMKKDVNAEKLKGKHEETLKIMEEEMAQELEKKKTILDQEQQQIIRQLQQTHKVAIEKLKDELQNKEKLLKESEVAEALETELDHLRNLIKKEEDTLKDLQNKVSILQQERLDILESKKELKNSLEEEGEMLKELQEEKSVVQKDIEELQEEAEKLENDLDILRREKTSLFSEVNSLKEKVSKEEDYIKELQDKKEILEKEYNEKKAEILKLSQDNQIVTKHQVTCKDAACQVKIVLDTSKTSDSVNQQPQSAVQGIENMEVKLGQRIEDTVENYMSQINKRMNFMEQHIKSLEGKLDKKFQSPHTFLDSESKELNLENSEMDLQQPVAKNKFNSDILEKPLLTSTPHTVFPSFSAAGDNVLPLYITAGSNRTCLCESGDSCEILKSLEQSLYTLHQQLHQPFLPLWTKQTHGISPLSGNNDQLQSFRVQFKDIRNKHHNSQLKFRLSREEFSKNSNINDSGQSETGQRYLDARRVDTTGNTSNFANWLPHASAISELNEDPIARARDIVQKEQARTWVQQQQYLNGYYDNSKLNYASQEIKWTHPENFGSGPYIPRAKANLMLSPAPTVQQLPISTNISSLRTSISAGFGVPVNEIYRHEIVTEEDIKADHKAWMTRISNMHQRIRTHEQMYNVHRIDDT